MHKVTDLNREGVLHACEKLINNGRSNTIVTLNSLMIMKSWHDERMSDAISNASLITADSVGISIASVILDKRTVRRYPGIEMMEDIISRGWKVFFLGSRDGVASKAAENMSGKYPRARICGAYHGYFNSSESDHVIDIINTCCPDVLFVGMNMMRQEKWIDANRDRIKAGIIIGVGGSFDVISGNLPRAPYILRAAGYEWLWRMIIQPKRIIRVIKLPVFMVEVLWRLFRGEGLLI